jgi:hypothetical protein
MGDRQSIAQSDTGSDTASDTGEVSASQPLPAEPKKKTKGSEPRDGRPNGAPTMQTCVGLARTAIDLLATTKPPVGDQDSELSPGLIAAFKR